MSHSLIESFLETYRSEKMKHAYRNHLVRFFKWLGKTPQQVVENYKNSEDKNAWLKEHGQLVTKYYNYHIGRSVKINTALVYVTPVRSFFRYHCDTLKDVKIDKPQMAYGEHEYKLSQLQQMFRVGDIKEKAILSLGVCLGYGASMFASLKREPLKNVMAQTESEEAPIGFWMVRGKTKQPIRSHLTVEAMQALQDYWKIAPPSEWAFPSNNGSKPISREALNYTLKALTEKAKIPVMGQIRWHLLRKFLFSGLTNEMSEMNAKLCVGKSIPIDILTYLKGKTEQLKQDFSKAEKYFTLSGMTNHNHSRLAELETKVQQQDLTITKFMETMTDFIAKRISEKDALERMQSQPHFDYTQRVKTLEALELLDAVKKGKIKIVKTEETNNNQ